MNKSFIFDIHMHSCTLLKRVVVELCKFNILPKKIKH